MDKYIFIQGDVAESISIMKEAAQWLIDAGKPLWSLEELNAQNLGNAPEEFIVMYDGGLSVATLVLKFEDRFFWPDVPRNTSGFIHKLAIRRKYAGQAMIKHLIDYAASVCREKGISSIRLDCDANRESLCAFYESLGFTLLERKLIDTPKFGIIHTALFQMDI